jgi:hypothetical protein
VVQQQTHLMPQTNFSVQREAFDDKDINHFTLGEPFPVAPVVRGPEYAELIKRSQGAED